MSMMQFESRKVAPDGGFGWVIVAAAAGVGVLYGIPGVVISVIFNDFKIALNATSSTLTWMVVITGFVTNIVGPVTASFTQWYSCRKAAIIGGVIMSLAMSFAYWSKSVTVLFFTFSILIGLGTSFAVNSSLFIINEYFEKTRGLAMGIRLTGYPLGRMALTPLCQLILEEYNYQAVVLITTAMLLNICVCGALFQPVKRHLKSVRICETPLDAIKPLKIEDCEKQTKDNEEEMSNALRTESKMAPEKNGDCKEVKRSFGRRVFDVFLGGLNFSLLKKPMFYAALVAGLANVVPITFSHVYLVSYGIEKGLTPMQSAWVTSAGSFADMAGRVILPIFMALPRVGGKKGSIIFTAVSGFAIIGIIASKTFWVLCLWSACLGFMVGGQMCAIFVIAAEIFGGPMVPTVFGLSQFIQGLVLISLGPILGLSNDVTGSFNVSYYVMAAQQFATAAMWFIILLVFNYCCTLLFTNHSAVNKLFEHHFPTCSLQQNYFVSFPASCDAGKRLKSQGVASCESSLRHVTKIELLRNSKVATRSSSARDAGNGRQKKVSGRRRRRRRRKKTRWKFAMPSCVEVSRGLVDMYMYLPGKL